MVAFSLAGAPLSVSHDATRAVNLLYCRSPRSILAVESRSHDGFSQKFVISRLSVTKWGRGRGRRQKFVS